MYLKSLEIQGFKSFADATKLEFHEGVTGIVGPNGCGKSNIVDSIRWVLGETSAKALRGGDMADVIFNGTEKRDPLGMAEVSLTLTGCEKALDVDFNEVSIGRRVYRDGKSEYLLNKQPCRLRDINDLLMDTGIGRTSYSIMEQGKIDLLLSSKPEDRRAVFEEAAGITKFKRDKKEAMRKLDYTEANLVRLADIIAEVERQMRSLQRQAGKARRYQALHSDVKVLDLHLSHRNFREQRAERSELENSVRMLREQQDALERGVETEERSIAESREAYQAVEAQINTVRRDVAERESEIQSATHRTEFNTERVHELSLLIRQNEEDLGDTSEKLGQQELDLEEADKMLASIVEKLEQQESQVEAHSNTAAELREKRETLSRELATTRQRRNEAESRLASLGARIESNQAQLDSGRERIAALEAEIGRLGEEEAAKGEEQRRLESQISERRASIQRFEEDLAAAEDAYQQARRDVDEVQQRLAEIHRQFAEKESRLEILRQLVAEGEGLEKGSQAVLRGLDRPDEFQNAVRGALASFIQVEPDFVPAIEAALGEHLQAIVVSDTDRAVAMIDALKSDQLGRATLVAESAARAHESRQLLANPAGAIGWALDHVRCEDTVRGLVDHLLGNVLLVEDLPAALRLQEEHPQTCLVTLAGELVTAAGTIRGGASADDAGSVLRRETDIRELAAVTKRLSEALEDAEGRRETLVTRVDELEQHLAEARERLQQEHLETSALEGQQAVVAKELQQVQNKLEGQRWELREVAERGASLEFELEEARAGHEEATELLQSCEQQLTNLGTSLETAERDEAEALDLLNQARTSLAVERRAREALENQREPMTGRVLELRTIIDRRRTEIDSYRERIDRCQNESVDLEARIVQLREAIVTLGASLTELEQDREVRATAVDEAEASLKEKRREIQRIAEQRGTEEVRGTQVELRIESLESAVRERYQVELERFEPDSHALLAALDEQRKARERSRKRRGVSDEEPSEEAAGEEAATSTDSPVDMEAPSIVAAANAAAPDAADRVETVLSEADEEAVTVPDPAEPDWDLIAEIVTEIRGRLDSMGPVNLDAIVEFEELEERHRFLTTQNEDTIKSKEELLQVIAKINRETRRLFAETFEKVRVNFQEMFRELFGPQGKADLILVDDSDPLESGIDVIAKPPGKKLQSITLLSGGERSMTAVALLFAIYMVKPSPFCVLDELDAPLDESNIGRFIKVLDRFIDDSQFIIVTHSKRTMSRADVMYGISMQEFGVSKTVGVKFTQETQPAGERKASRTSAAGEVGKREAAAESKPA